MKDIALPPQTDLRAPSDVMRLARMGQSFPMRLSFLRILIRRLAEDQAVVTRPVWEMSAEGFGHAVYSLRLGGRAYSLVMVSQALADEDRSDRVIATAWDAAFVLFDGVPTAEDLARIRANAPKQEAGRFTEKDLVLSRANKSVRLWRYVVDCLQRDVQPEAEKLAEVGYLMRTTAVYGNGKFGIADRHLIADRPELNFPFAAEMLTVWLIRHATIDLVSHVGGMRLADDLARNIGIGNATGLGMAPFLVSHPVLLNNWVMARETALSRARAMAPTAALTARLKVLAARAQTHVDSWRVPDAEAQAELDALRSDWAAFASTIETAASPEDIYAASLSGSFALQELTAALLIEAADDLVNGLGECMADPFGAPLTGFTDTDALRSAIQAHAAWALRYDFADTTQTHRFWYVSANKKEPRLGARWEEDGAELETPLDIARQIHALYADIPDHNRVMPDFLGQFPQHSHAVARVNLASRYPYAEIHDNLIAESTRPIDMLRFKLSFFGATRFDPKSDLWTRVTLAQGAPLAHQLGPEADDWWLA